MGYAGDLLLDPIREAVGLRAIPSAAEDVEVVLGELGERAELLARLRSCSTRPARPGTAHSGAGQDSGSQDHLTGGNG